MTLRKRKRIDWGGGGNINDQQESSHVAVHAEAEAEQPPSSNDSGPVEESSSTTTTTITNHSHTSRAREECGGEEGNVQTTHSICHPDEKQEEGSSSLSWENDQDQGHRYGNFKNYYHFHPPANRIQILKELLEYVVAQHSTPVSSTTGTTTTAAAAAGSEESMTNLPPKLQVASSSSSSSSSSTSSFIYCDVGCNEGDLTLEVSKALRTSFLNHPSSASSSEAHSAGERRKRTIQHTLKVIGIDLDAKLVERANAKVHTAAATTTNTNNHHQDTKFMSSSSSTNRRKDDNNNDIALSSSPTSSAVKISYEFRQADMTHKEQLETSIPTKVHLLSLFSTTMWLHIHAGDDGFRNILNQLCAKTTHFFIIEPQPSKCYRTAMVRLRKAGRAVLDVSTERLQLRPRIEEEIDAIMKANHFYPANITTTSNSNSSANGLLQPHNPTTRRTEWNRSIRLYEKRQVLQPAPLPLETEESMAATNITT